MVCNAALAASVIAANILAFGGTPTTGSQSGGELRFAIRAEPKTLDPHRVMDEPSKVVQYLTAGVLIRQNRLTQQLEPSLATAWKISSDGKSIDFQLREGVIFSDGTPFKADDVAYTLRRVNDPTIHCPQAEGLKSTPGEIAVEVRSPSRVVVKVPGRVANLAELFDEIAIVSANSPKKMAATLGPFQITEYKPGSHLQLRRNPYYWKKDDAGKQLPYLDSVRLEIITNRELEIMRFRRGDIHLMSSLDGESFDRLTKEMPGALRDLGASLDSEQFWFNQAPSAKIPAYKLQWFQNTAFRQAVSTAINRADICRLVYRTHASEANTSVSPGNRIWMNSAIKARGYSPEAALELLTKAGFRKDGGKLYDNSGHLVEFSVITNAGSKARERTAALIQQDLNKIGIRLNVIPMDFPALIERITRTFEYEACLLGQLIDIDPNEVMNVWRSSAPNHQWNPNQAKPATAWEAEIDRLMDEQASSLDLKKRKAAFDRVQEIIAEQQPFIYLVHKNALVAISPHVRNAQPAVLQPQTFWNVDTIALNSPSGR